MSLLSSRATRVPACHVLDVELPRLDTLEDVLAWCHASGHALVDVIVQDEYTHDVIVRAREPSFVVFDTT